MSEAISNRVIVERTVHPDGWTELFLACGHVVTIITAVGEGLPAPCPQCINELLERAKHARA